MMTPTLVLENGEPRLALGSAGSVRLAGAIAQVTDAVLRGASVAEAIERPRIHVDGDDLHLEGGLAELAPDGWNAVRWAGRNLFFGGVSAVERRADGSLAAAGDPRRGGHGIVVGDTIAGATRRRRAAGRARRVGRPRAREVGS